jgi:hypothetical protein
MYGVILCWTVTPLSADCENIVLLASDYEEGTTIHDNDIPVGRETTKRKRGMLQRLGPHVWIRVGVCTLYRLLKQNKCLDTSNEKRSEK